MIDTAWIIEYINRPLCHSGVYLGPRSLIMRLMWEVDPRRSLRYYVLTNMESSPSSIPSQSFVLGVAVRKVVGHQRSCMHDVTPVLHCVGGYD
jgi:hypothetical protein